MHPHLAIHRRCDEKRGLGCQSDRCERIIRDAACEFGYRVRSGWSDQKKIRRVGQGNVAGMPGFLFVENSCCDRIARQCLESERRDKLGGMFCHHHIDIAPSLREAACELGGLVAGDGAADTEDDIFFVHAKSS